MFGFRKTCFEIRPFALLPAKYETLLMQTNVKLMLHYMKNTKSPLNA